jgi:hypothetical protein
MLEKHCVIFNIYVASPWSRENSVRIPSYIIPRGSINGLIPAGIQRAAFKYGPIGPDLLHCTSQHSVPNLIVTVALSLNMAGLTCICSAFRQLCLP